MQVQKESPYVWRKRGGKARIKEGKVERLKGDH
jgi:hypothetical protein